jgi:RNA polymerase sigma-70 factor, ECF subfamily
VKNDPLADFVSVRRRLFGVAYRMLGSAAEAEDVVQEAWLRWQGTDHGVVRDAPAFLVTMTVRLAINVATSARARRETYVGPWLPEPVDTSSDPELGAARADALELAVLLLLEKLTPTERAAYVLREAFDYPYQQIADALELAEPNARQLVSRARKHIADERRATVSATERRRLLEAFIDAARLGDATALEALFAADIVSRSDGNGAPHAARKLVIGRERVAAMIAKFSTHFWEGASFEWIQANGQPCLLASRNGAAYVLVAIEASAEGIDHVMWVMSPAKLVGFSPDPSRTLRAPSP